VTDIYNGNGWYQIWDPSLYTKDWLKNHT
jgi:hypothetical protein